MFSRSPFQVYSIMKNLPLLSGTRGRCLGLLTALLIGSGLDAQNVILFIGDGMGYEQVKAARSYNGAALSFEAFPYQAQVTTSSANNSVTDSAAAGTALATGVKVNNYVVSIAIPGDGADLETTLEFHRDRGRMTGLITTTYLTHATPATFGAHTIDRNNTVEIADDYLTVTLPNILFGGGGNGLTVEDTRSAGYAVATTVAAFDALNTSATHLSAQFGNSFLPYEFDHLDPAMTYPYPHLADMVTKALATLERHSDGFFLMVEGGMIDQACHGNELERSIHETLELARAVQVALDWAYGRTDTLILVTADHETGGLKVTQDNGVGQYPIVTWSTTGHTGANVPAYAWGLDAHRVAGVLDNSDIHRICTGKPIPVYSSLVAAGSTWKYDASGMDLGTDWTAPFYDDSGWSSGPAKLGYGDGDEVTIIPKTSPVFPCYYFRHTFDVDEPSGYAGLSLRILRDDGAVVYLNGIEVARYSLPDGPVSYNTWASTAADYPWDPAVLIPSLLVPGPNVLAVEVHQCNSTSSDLALDLELKAQRLSGAPSTPLLTAVPGDGIVTLTWTASHDPEGDPVTYSLYRRLVGEVYGDALATDLKDTTYVDREVENGITYGYVVRVLDPAENHADSAEVLATPVIPDYTAYVVHDPTMTYGTVSGRYADLAPDTPGVQTLKEAKVGVAGRLDAEYSLQTSARPAEVIAVTLQLAGSYADLNDPLIVWLWTGADWSDITPLVASQSYDAPVGCIDPNGIIRVRFTDSVNARKETLGVLTLEDLYAVVTVGEPGPALNRAPVAHDDEASTPVGTPTHINVLANDYDPDGDLLTVTVASQPANGTAVLNPEDQTLEYAPAGGYTGPDSFTYTVSDGRGGTATAAVFVEVTPVESAPTVAVVGITLSATAAGKNWKATALVTIMDQAGSAAMGGTVVGDWLFNNTPIQTGVSATADASGCVGFTSPPVKTSSGTFMFVVTSVLYSGHTFVGGVESGSISVPAP
jgi:alkaline phosphatase